MRTILETPERGIYVDGDSLIKTGPADSLEREAYILGLLVGVRGVPRVRSFSTSLGGKRKTLMMDLMPGEPVDRLRDGMLAQIGSMVAMLYDAGVAHMRLRPEHVLYGNGVVSLVGFSKASVLRCNPMARWGLSPDVTGELSEEFKAEGPLSHPEGCIHTLLEALKG